MGATALISKGACQLSPVTMLGRGVCVHHPPTHLWGGAPTGRTKRVTVHANTCPTPEKQQAGNTKNAIKCTCLAV